MPRTREDDLIDALDRIARFAEAYEGAIGRFEHDNQFAGRTLVLTLGQYARRALMTHASAER